jgi:hypothetical protein
LDSAGRDLVTPLSKGAEAAGRVMVCQALVWGTFIASEWFPHPAASLHRWLLAAFLFGLLVIAGSWAKSIAEGACLVVATAQSIVGAGVLLFRLNPLGSGKDNIEVMPIAAYWLQTSLVVSVVCAVMFLLGVVLQRWLGRRITEIVG